MNAAAPATARRVPQLPLLLLILAAGALLLWFLRLKVHFFIDFSAESYGPYFAPRQAGMTLHIFGGLVAVSTGLVQLWLGLTGRTGTWHRNLGRTYLMAILAGVTGGMYLALTIPGPRVAYQAGLVMLNAAWLITSAMAYWSVRRCRIEQHRQWMLRSYLVTFAFVTFRLGADSLSSLSATHAGLAVDQIEAMMAWACWAVPLLVAEPLIQWRAAVGRK